MEKEKGEVGERGEAAAPAPAPKYDTDAVLIEEVDAWGADVVVADGELAVSDADGSLHTMGGVRRRWCGLTPIEGESRSSEASPLRTCLDRKQGSFLCCDEAAGDVPPAGCAVRKGEVGPCQTSHVNQER